MEKDITPPKGRTLVCGDIHGCYKGLLQCLERSGFDKEVDTLIQLGDVADGWSEVPECVEELLSIKNLIAIQGNHDFWLKKWMNHGIITKWMGWDNKKQEPKEQSWLDQGGQATFDAYNQFHTELLWKHEQQFFNKQILYYVDDQNRAFVHGGYSSHEGLGNEGDDMYLWDRELWSIALAHQSKVTKSILRSTKTNRPPRRLRPHEEIFIGHTSTLSWGEDKPMHAHNVWNLDTGAGYNGKLTIMDVDTKEYWQSDFSKVLYQNEVGK